MTVAVITGMFGWSMAANAQQVWTVNGGQTSLHFDVQHLQELGLTALVADRTSSGEAVRKMTFDVSPRSSFSFRTIDGVIESFAGGEVRHDQSLLLISDEGQYRLQSFAIRYFPNSPSQPLAMVAGKSSVEDALLQISETKIGFSATDGSLKAEGAGFQITQVMADLLGRPELAGEVIGEIRFVADATVTRTFEVPEEGVITNAAGETLNQPAMEGQRGTVETDCSHSYPGPDVIVGMLPSVCDYSAQEVDNEMVDAFSVGTTSCNLGSETLLWIANTPDHPVIGQNMYKLKDNRLIQLGQSWLKHGFTSLQGSVCCSCQGGGDGDHLGLGCSDPYGCGLNGGQGNAGSKSEVNAYTGTFPYPREFTPEWSGTIARRLQVRSAALEDNENSDDVTFIVEGQYATWDDAQSGNGFNNASWAEVRLSGGPDNFNVVSGSLGETHRQRNGIYAWQWYDPTVQITDVFIPDEGELVVAHKAIDLGNGFWRYEYAVANNNSDRSARSFSVPLPGNVDVQNIGFHDVFYHDSDPWDGADWVGTYDGETVTWSTDTFDENPDANAIRWATMYNFWFETTLEPDEAPADVELGLFKPGTPMAVYASIGVPTQGPPDCDGDGIPDPCELSCDAEVVIGQCQLEGCGQQLDCNGNDIPDECEQDCNGNSIPDDCDMANGTSLDMDGNNFPDECRVMRVNASAPDGGHGASWDGALNSVEDALLKAKEYDGLVEEIWVAAGTYTPDGSNYPDPRKASFLPIAGVKMYGGFAGNEDLLEEADPATNITILSGDQDGDDGVGMTNMDDNSYHVIWAVGNGEGATISGFTITGGNADEAPLDFQGGGVYLVDTSLTLDNNVIKGNRAVWGGGVYLRGLIAPTLLNNSLYGNEATSVGGGLANVLASPVMMNIVVVGNIASTGAGVFLNGGSPEIYNATVTANVAGNVGGGIRGAGSLTLVNSLMWNNSDTSGTTEAAQLSVTGGLLDVHHNSIMNIGLFAGNDNIDADPKFMGVPSDGGDGWIVGGNDDYGNLHLDGTSNVVDSGDPVALPAWATVDRDGNARVQGPGVDMGAYERAAEQTPGACCLNNACSFVASADACVNDFVCNVTTNELPDCGGACGTTCLGDVNGDGVVTVADRGFVSANVGNTDLAAICQFDLDGNGVINVSDRGFVSANVGVCTPLPDYMDGSGMNNGSPDTRFGEAVFTPGATCEIVDCGE